MQRGGDRTRASTYSLYHRILPAASNFPTNLWATVYRAPHRTISTVVLLIVHAMLSSVLSSGLPTLIDPETTKYLPFNAASEYFYLPIDDEIHLEEPSTSTLSHSCTRSLGWDSSEESSTDHSDDSPTRPSSPTTPRSRHRRQQEITDILEQKDLYNILGLSRTAASDKMELRRAYLSRSRACHPE